MITQPTVSKRTTSHAVSNTVWTPSIKLELGRKTKNSSSYSWTELARIRVIGVRDCKIQCAMLKLLVTDYSALHDQCIVQASTI